MFEFLSLFSSFSVARDRRTRLYLEVVALIAFGVGLVGFAGVSGILPQGEVHVPLPFGSPSEIALSWWVLIVLFLIWFALVIPAEIYFRLRDASVGKPDAED